MAMLKPKEMAKRIGVTVKTLQAWDNNGTLKAHRTPTNRRYYTEEQYLKYIGHSNDKTPTDKIQLINSIDSIIDTVNGLTQQLYTLRKSLNGGDNNASSGKGKTISKSNHEKKA